MLSLKSSAVDFVIVSRFHIGQKFEDFSAFESAIERYQNAEYVQFWKRDSRTISAAQSRLPKKSRWTLDWNTMRSVTTASKAGSPSNLRAREWENRGMYVFSSVHLSKRQILFSGKNKKNINANLSSAELAQRVVKVKERDYYKGVFVWFENFRVVLTPSPHL